MNHAGWEPIWSGERIPERYASFAAPNESVVEWADGLPPGADIFDLGCGVGRHVIYLGGRGFRMAGADVSPTAIQRTYAACAERDIVFEGRVCEMTVLPWPDESFDAALSTSTIHHGLRATIKAAVGEVQRVLRPGGSFLVDFPSTDRVDYHFLRAEVAAGHIVEVEPNTFVDERPDSEDPDGFLPHHFCDEVDVRDLLGVLTIERLELDLSAGARGRWIAWGRKM
jgi:tellurite methyltransferase